MTEPRPGGRRGLIVVVGAWLAVHVAYFASGGRLSTAALDTSWQLLDVEHLRADPFGSVALLHIQPPAYNLFVGVVERWSPWPAATYELVYAALGLTLVVTLRALLLELGLRGGAATTGAVVVAVNPVVMSYQYTVTYELPVATALVVGAWLAARYVRTRTTGWLVACVATLTLATLTRALLHPAWLVAVVVLLLVGARPRDGGRAVAVALVIPVVLVGGWITKNAVLFDEPSLSSMLGSNLARGVIAPMPRSVVDDLVADGTISAAARVRAFSPYRAYQPDAGPCRTDWTQAVVRALRKENRLSNFNSVCFLPVYRDEQHNAFVLLRERPLDYLGTRYAPFTLHFLSDVAPGLGRYHDDGTLQGLKDVWDVVLVPVDVTIHDSGWTNNLIPGAPPPVSPLSLTLVAATLLVVGWGVRSAWRLVRRRGEPMDVVRVLIGGTVLFVLLVSIGTEYGENGRFRFLVDPFVLGVATALVVDVVTRRIEDRRAPVDAPPEPASAPG